MRFSGATRTTLRHFWPALRRIRRLASAPAMGFIGPAGSAGSPWIPLRTGHLRAGNTTFRILVVDDDPDACEILTHVLTHLGYSAVCIIQDSVEALRRMQREHFDLMLVDLVMPGLSGFDLLRAARSASPRPTAVIAVSSYNEFRHKATDMGFDSFVAKPVELAKLRPLLERMLPSA